MQCSSKATFESYVIKHQLSTSDQQLMEIKAFKFFQSGNLVNYCITVIVFNAGRKAEVLDKFCV